MTTRVQTLRSSTTGNVPAAGTRMPGELWTNFPDLQMGVIDASKNAQRLVAVRYFSTQANYVVGDFVIQAGALYVAKVAVTAGAFNAGQWTYIGSSTDPNGPFLPLVGGTLTGALTLAADPGAALGAATKQYVDGKVTAAPYLPLVGGTLTGMLTLVGPPTNPTHAATKAYVDSGSFMPVSGGANTGLNDTRILNGDMRIDQRGVASGGGAAVNVYVMDCWFYGSNQAGKLDWAQAALNGSIPSAKALNFTTASAYTALAADLFYLVQFIEADMVYDLWWGNAAARPVTLSFWVFSSLTGTFGGSIENGASTRSYPFTYSIPTANTWTKIALTIPGDTGGTWTLSGNGRGLLVCFDLGTGATYRGPPGAWVSGNFVGANGGVSIVAVASASIYFTEVKLEIGSVATPFPRQSLAKSMADCQRYYEIGSVLGSFYAVPGTFSYVTQPFQVNKRAQPTVTLTAFSGGNVTATVVNTISNNNFNINCTVTATGNSWISNTFAASAEL